MRNTSVLIPDGDSPFAFHVITCLGSAKDVDVHVLAEDPRALIRYSRWVKSFHVLKKDQDMADGVAEVCSHVPVDLCMPVSTRGHHYFSQHREKVEKSTRLVLIASRKALMTAWDKAKFAEVLAGYALPHPHTISSRTQFDREISGLSLPVLVKARFGGGGKGIDKYSERGELIERVHAEGEFFDKFIIQEYTEGEDIDCSVFCRNGKILAYAIQKGFMVDPKSYGSHTAIEFIHHPGVLDLAAKLMSALGWNGIAHIDTRVRNSDQSIDIIEINTRYWGSLEGSLHAGINFPYIACKASLGERFPAPEYRNKKYMSAPAALKRLIRRKSALHLIRDTNLLMHLKDPIPSVLRLVRKTE